MLTLLKIDIVVVFFFVIVSQVFIVRVFVFSFVWQLKCDGCEFSKTGSLTRDPDEQLKYCELKLKKKNKSENGHQSGRP